MWPVFKKGERLYYPILRSMVRAFGDYLADDLKSPKKPRRQLPLPAHQEPIFD